MPAHFEPHNILTLTKAACKKQKFVKQTQRNSEDLKNEDTVIFLLCCVAYF